MESFPTASRIPLLFAVVLLALSALAPPPAAAVVEQITITPADPTVCDPVGIEVLGTVPSSCYEVVVGGIRGPIPPDPACMAPICPPRFEVRIYVREPAPGTACPAMIAPYSRTFRVGRLPVGPYIVRAVEYVIPWEIDSTQIFAPRESSEVVTTFSVKPAECPAPPPGCYILGFHRSDMPGVEMPSPYCTTVASPRGTACVDVLLYNTTPAAGVQSEFAIYDPFIDPAPTEPTPSRAFSLESVEAVGAAKGFVASPVILPDGVVRVILYSPDGAALPSPAGPILRLCYNVAADARLGEYTIVHRNEVVSDPEGNGIPPCPTLREPTGRICVVRPGCDVNDDGVSNILDVVRIVRCALAPPDSGGACPDTVAARADCNGDGMVNVLDVVCCVRKILRLRAEGPGTPPYPFASFPSEPASVLGFAGDVEWRSSVEGRATLRFRPGPGSGGGEWMLYADPSRARIADLAIRSGPPGVRLEWVEGHGGRLYAMLLSESGAAIGGEVLIDARVERVIEAAGRTSLVVADFVAATTSGVAAMSGIDRPTAVVPATTLPAPAVYPARPNPFVGESEITFALPAAEKVTLRVYDVHGRLVRTLVNESRAAGVHHERWDGRDDAGRDRASGVYLVQFRAGAVTDTERILRLK
jgi:hypothetical protein